MRYNKFLNSVWIFLFCICISCTENINWNIKQNNNLISIQAGILRQELILSDSLLQSTFYIDTGKVCANEFSFVLWKASPNEEPQGIAYMKTGVEQKETIKNQTDALNIEQKNQNSITSNVSWYDSIQINSSQVENYTLVSSEIKKISQNEIQLTLMHEINPNYPNVKFNIIYRIYKGFPVIRKWMSIKNESNYWIKVDHLMLSKNNIPANYSQVTHLTPQLRNIDPSIVSFSNADASQGFIQLSEVPSQIRILTDDGNVGYHPSFFEWVLGPRESFQSDPVSIYAFNDESYETISALSTARDRCVEGEFRNFLKHHILMQPNDPIAPLFCTWTNYGSSICDKNMFQAVDIAANIGFKCFQLDAGWSDTGSLNGWAVSDRKADIKKFADLKSLSKYIHSKKMKTGLWYSVFINEQNAMQQNASPVLFSVPLVKRGGGLGLSFTYQKSREKYVGDLIALNKEYDATYFKQDLSNICYGDFAKGHESRTLKESYLRGIKGLFTTQDKIHATIPNIFLQLSHEIYWQTPGPAADIAVLQHADVYHIPPNEYWGAGERRSLVSDTWNMNKDSLSNKLLYGCLRARNLWYAHRGLPLERLEVFGAVVTNYKGSLTTEIQDRQICSWLMGAPSSFSGDLTSLSNENIKHYHKRFELLDTLQKKYDIYSNFQFSGVPSPTDEDWHWWGKLNQEGSGIVIVMRGSKGENSRNINIPWVLPQHKYKIKGLLSQQDYGIWTGKQLHSGKLELLLPPYGQEIIELINQK